MSVSGTNQSKSVVSPYGTRKAGIFLWSDTLATWADSTAVWAGVSITPTNQTKSSTGSTTISAGSPMGLLLSITYPTTVVVGSGVINQTKN